MEPQQTTSQESAAQTQTPASRTIQASRLQQVTSLSKYLALALFIILPFIGGFVGYQLAPEKVVIKEVEVDNGKEQVVDSQDVEDEVGRRVVTTHTAEEKSNQGEESAYKFVIEVDGEDDGKIPPPVATVFLDVDGDRFELYSAPEYCSVRGDRTSVDTILSATNSRSEFMSEYISTPDEILSGVSCWLAGGGYELYLIDDGTKTRVIGFSVSETGEYTEFSPFGEVEILYQ